MSAVKRPKTMPSTTQIIIPSGDFSLETTMALALLKFVLREYTVIPLDETDPLFPQKLHTYQHTPNTVVVGIGGHYMPQQSMFHWSPDEKIISRHNNKNNKKQKSSNNKSKKGTPIPQNVFFNNTRRCKIVPLATVGLIYRFHGKEILKKITNFTDSAKINWLYERAYFDFIEIIDAHARNIGFYNKNLLYPPAVPRYNADQHSLPNLVKFYNLQLHDYELINYDDSEIHRLRANRLETVVDILYSAFENYVKYFAFSFMQGETKLQQAYDASLSGETFQEYFSQDSSSSASIEEIQRVLHRIVIMPEFIPWKEHLFAYEKKLGLMGNALYAIFPDSSRNWRVAAVPIQSSSFESRKRFPQKWCGLSDNELTKISGVEDATFVHSQGFIAGANSLSGCIRLAVEAVLNEKVV